MKKLGGVKAMVSNKTPVNVTMSAEVAAALVGKLARAAAGGRRVRLWVAPGGGVYVDRMGVR
jgi:hypothetical protein